MMRPNSQQMYLKEAEAAHANVKRTAEKCAKHPKTCWLCRSKLVSYLLHCPTRLSLVYEHLTAKIDAAPYQINLVALREEKKLADAAASAPTDKWLEKLYKLRDDRTE